MQSTAFCFTINNYTPHIEALLQSRDGYVVYGYEEAPTTGTKHLQGYMETPMRVRVSALGKLYRGHFEVAKGSCYQNFQYCTKSGKYWTNDETFDEDSFPSPSVKLDDPKAHWMLCSMLSQAANNDEPVSEGFWVKHAVEMSEFLCDGCSGMGHAARFLHDH